MGCHCTSFDLRDSDLLHHRCLRKLKNIKPEFELHLKGNPPTYKRWSAKIGGWLVNEETGETAFEYSALGMALTIVINLAVVLPIVVYMISAWYRKVTLF